jgi:hypothetical protein
LFNFEQTLNYIIWLRSLNLYLSSIYPSLEVGIDLALSMADNLRGTTTMDQKIMRDRALSLLAALIVVGLVLLYTVLAT